MEWTIEFYLLLFRFIMVYSWEFEMPAPKHPQKSVGYKNLKRVM